MADRRYLDKSQARDIEEELFATRRQQASRHVPVHLPRQNFWEMVGKLLADIDSDIQHMLMNGITGLRLQNAQKRQANIRRIASELSRKRLVSMMQYLATQSLRTDSQTGLTQDLPPLDWQRHDPAEKAFYNGIVTQMDRFKKEIDWKSMQKGILGEGISEQRVHSRGTMQLDSFIDKPEGLTGQSPPDLIIEDELPDIELIDSQYDEEDRIFEQEWSYIEGSQNKPQTSNNQQSAVKDSVTTKKTGRNGDKHKAALELAPSKGGNAKNIDTDGEFETKNKQNKNLAEQLEDSLDKYDRDEMIRIRIIQSLPEAIVLGDGIEIELEVDDIHLIEKETADWLVESGVAEVEML